MDQLPRLICVDDDAYDDDDDNDLDDDNNDDDDDDNDLDDDNNDDDDDDDAHRDAWSCSNSLGSILPPWRCKKIVSCCFCFHSKLVQLLNLLSPLTRITCFWFQICRLFFLSFISLCLIRNSIYFATLLILFSIFVVLNIFCGTTTTTTTTRI